MANANMDVVGRMNERQAGLSPELQAHVRWEYRGDAAYALGQIAREGRARPAGEGASVAGAARFRLVRVATALVAFLIKVGVVAR